MSSLQPEARASSLYFSPLRRGTRRLFLEREAASLRELCQEQKRRCWKLVGECFAPREPAASPQRLRVLNRTRGTVLATRLEVAGSGPTRRKGLLEREGLAAGEGLWIIPCESVHTFFMRFAIDLVYLDRKNRIRKLRSGVGPWRLSACLSAHSVLELASGTIRSTRTERGDALEFEPAPPEGCNC